MKWTKTVLGLMVALVLVGVFTVNAMAKQGNADSITLSIDRTPMGQTIFHPGRHHTAPATVTVRDFMIRDYTGLPIEGFVMKTCSGRTMIPLETVMEIRLSRWSSRRTDDIFLIENVVEVEIDLTDGTTRIGLMNADFGTVEGQTELGDFFLGDPLYVRHLLFNR